MRITVLGDLHLFSGRSNQRKVEKLIRICREESDTLIFCGDLFDFRWSGYSSLEIAFDMAVSVLESLLSESDKPFVYILGNHDGILGFQKHLTTLAQRFKHFSWDADLILIGSTLIIHGDIPIYSKGERLTGREWKLDYIHSPFYRLGYSLCTHLRLIAFYRLIKRAVKKGNPVELIYSALQKEEVKGITHVIFGHTHLSIHETAHNGILFRNCGTPMSGFSFHPVSFDTE